MRSKWKRLTHSLLALLMAVAMVMCGIISVLIFWVAEQSVNNFEDFTIRQRQQETSIAAASLSQDMDSLNTLMTNTLFDSSLVYVQHYLDSDTLTYSYLQQVSVLQKQLLTIERAIPLASSVKIYMQNNQRVLSSSSLLRYEPEETPWLNSMFANTAQRVLVEDGRMYLYSAKQAGDLLFHRSVAMVCAVSPDELRPYLQKYVSEESSIAVFCGAELFASFGSLPAAFEEGAAEKLAANRSGAEQLCFDSVPHLITWTTTTLDSVKLCQVTPMSFVTDQLHEYQKQITIVMSAAIVLVVALVIFLYIMACHPIRRLKTALTRVENGDLSVRISPTWSNEFQQIFGQFNRMTKKLEQLIEQEYKLKLLNANAELKQMHYQINPHFLYNAYFNMRALLWDEEYDVAMRLAELMGRYLRYITTGVEDKVTLKEEMAHSIAYLEIQKLRFGSQLEIRVRDCPSWAENLPIPRLIVQPLIENTFVHGFRGCGGTNVVSVEVIAGEEALSIVVEDNGGTVTDEVIADVQRNLASGGHDTDGTSVALLNIHRRIVMLYPEGSGLFVSRSALGGFRSEIRITGEKRHVSDADR